MPRGGTVMDYGGLSELNLEDTNGRPMTNPSRSRVSSRPLSRYRPDDSEDEENDIVHVSRPRSRIRHSSESSSSLEANRIDNQDILPHSAQEFGLSSRSRRRHDSGHASDYRRSYHPTDYDDRSYRDDGGPYRDDGRSHRDDRSYRDRRPYRDDRSYRDDHRHYRDDDPYHRERSRSRHRSRDHRSSRYRDHLEEHEGRLPVILMFDNGRGR